MSASDTASIESMPVAGLALFLPNFAYLLGTDEGLSSRSSSMSYSTFVESSQSLDEGTAVFHAIEKDQIASATLLIDKGANVNIKTNDGTALMDIVPDKHKTTMADAIKERRQTSAQELYPAAIKKFNAKYKLGLTYMIQEGIIEDTPEDISRFLHKKNAELSKTQVGDLLGSEKPKHIKILDAFVNRMNFEGMSFDIAIRSFLQSFMLPGEAQKIDRIMERFAMRYVKNNPDTFPDSDTAFILAFSVIMLNTDAHHPSIPKKMSKAEWIMNNRNIWGPDKTDPPKELLEELYDHIVTEEIKFEKENEVFSNPEKKGFLKKRTGGSRGWKTRWFVLKDNLLYWFKNPVKSGDDSPGGIIPLEEIKFISPPGKKTFSMVSLVEGGNIKCCKLERGKVLSGQYREIQFMVDTTELRDQWVSALKSSLVQNPFFDRLQKLRARADKSDAVKPSVPSSATNWKEYHEMANLCAAAYKTPDQIKQAYGKRVSHAASAKLVKYFILTNRSAQSHTVVLAGNLWDDSAMKKNLTASKKSSLHAAFKSHYKVDKILGELVHTISKYLEVDYSLKITGHSLGAVFAVFLGIAFASKKQKPTQIVTFGQPMIISDKEADQVAALGVTRIMDVNDPTTLLFKSFKHVGREITLLKGNYYCLETKTLTSEDPEDFSTTPIFARKAKAKKRDISEQLESHLVENYARKIKQKYKGIMVLPKDKSQYLR